MESDNSKEAIKLLSNEFQTRGDILYRDKRLLEALINDFFAVNQKLLKLLRLAVQEGIADKIVDLLRHNVDEQKILVTAIVSNFAKDYGMSKVHAAVAVRILASGAGVCEEVLDILSTIMIQKKPPSQSEPELIMEDPTYSHAKKEHDDSVPEQVREALNPDAAKDTTVTSQSQPMSNTQRKHYKWLIPALAVLSISVFLLLVFVVGVLLGGLGAQVVETQPPALQIIDTSPPIFEYQDTPPLTLEPTPTPIPAPTTDANGLYEYAYDPSLAIDFEPVTHITGLPDSMYIGGEYDLWIEIHPWNATITGPMMISVLDPGTTGAYLSDNALVTYYSGVMHISITIPGAGVDNQDFTQDFYIAVLDRY